MLTVTGLVAWPVVAAAGDSTNVFTMDRCEPDSFNAAIGAGTCVRNGGVTFGNFLARANPKDGGHNAWRFSRHDVSLSAGEHLTAINNGGENHTFTESPTSAPASCRRSMPRCLRARLPRSPSARSTSSARARR